ncbi:MAG: glycosyltransferase family 4 protein [Patescibacteria group bacterium]
MVIGIDASGANKKNKTGVEWYSYYLIQELKKISLKKEDNFILYSPNKLIGDLGILPPKWQAKILKWPLKYLWTQIRLSWEMIFNRPDLLFIPSHALPIFCRTKTVITLHDLGFERLPKAYPFWQRIYTRFVYKWAVNHASKIITISEFTKKELIDLYKADRQKIEVIYLGYDKSIFQLIDNEKKIDQILEKYKIKGSYILYVGRLEKKKNIKNLLQAFIILQNLSPHLQLVLIGQPGFGYKEIRNYKSKVKNVIELNYVGHQDLPYLYARAECFVYPSLCEGFGLPILEAMACGCPVVASAVSSIPEIGGEAVLYFRPENSEEIAKAILKIIKDRELREELKQRGLERVKKYSWQKCAEETLSVITNL